MLHLSCTVRELLFVCFTWNGTTNNMSLLNCLIIIVFAYCFLTLIKYHYQEKKRKKLFEKYILVHVTSERKNSRHIWRNICKVLVWCGEGEMSILCHWYKPPFSYTSKLSWQVLATLVFTFLSCITCSNSSQGIQTCFSVSLWVPLVWPPLLLRSSCKRWNYWAETLRPSYFWAQLSFALETSVTHFIQRSGFCW